MNTQEIASVIMEAYKSRILTNICSPTDINKLTRLRKVRMNEINQAVDMLVQLGEIERAHEATESGRTRRVLKFTAPNESVSEPEQEEIVECSGHSPSEAIADAFRLAIEYMKTFHESCVQYMILGDASIGYNENMCIESVTIQIHERHPQDVHYTTKEFVFVLKAGEFTFKKVKGV